MENNQTRQFFAFRHAKSNELIRIECQGSRYYLSDFSDGPVFEQETESGLMAVLRENMPGYNSSSQRPGWGRLKREDLLPVRVTVSTTFEPLALPEKRQVRASLGLRRITEKLARKYAGGDAQWPKDAALYFWLVALPEGLSLEQAQESWTGQENVKSKWDSRTVYAVCKVPSDYIPLLEGQSGALFIASEATF